MNISLTVTHIQGIRNTVADLFSRWFVTPDNVNTFSQYVDNPVLMNADIDLTI